MMHSSCSLHQPHVRRALYVAALARADLKSLAACRLLDMSGSKDPRSQISWSASECMLKLSLQP